MRALQLGDWLDDLGEFPAPMVAEAIRDYRQSEDHRKRPMPGDIRLRCIAIQRQQREDREREERKRALPDYSSANERRAHLKRQYAEAEEARNAWARECGFPDFQAAMEFGIVAADKRRRA